MASSIFPAPKARACKRPLIETMTGSIASFLKRPRSWAKKTGSMLRAGDGTAMMAFSGVAGVWAETSADKASSAKARMRWMGKEYRERLNIMNAGRVDKANNPAALPRAGLFEGVSG